MSKLEELIETEYLHLKQEKYEKYLKSSEKSIKKKN